MSGKSKEEIAFELLSKLKGVGVWGEQNMPEILDMYVECLEATSGLRAVKGGTPVALRLSGQGAAPAKPAKAVPAAAPAPRQAAPQQAAPQQAAPARQVAAPQQPPAPQQPQVRQQQQMVQQAFQQQQGQQPR